jgi:signal transduction histidine kinase
MLVVSLSNFARHGAGSCVVFVLRAVGHSLCLEVVVDGAGMDATARNKQGSFGLLGMRERVQRLHGSLQIDSAPGDGTRLTVSLPLPAATDVG